MEESVSEVKTKKLNWGVWEGYFFDK